jgi:hypothetical protein
MFMTRPDMTSRLNPEDQKHVEEYLRAPVPAPSRAPAFPAVDAPGGGVGSDHWAGPVEPTYQLSDAMSCLALARISLHRFLLALRDIPMTHRIVIVGGGAGGLELATRLGKTLGKRGTASVMLVDANLTHIWKPLLHEVAAGSLNSSEDELNYVAQAKWNHFEFQLGRMSGLDRAQKANPAGRHADENGNELVPARKCPTTRW